MLPRGVLEILGEEGVKKEDAYCYGPALGLRKENSSASSGLLCSWGADFRLKHFSLSVLWLQ